ncbi:hypothetical protein C5F48_24165 [Cereibacter changlensis JA139]|uniref:Uncharacterized protein n=2 Tax=Cereibacter changlensis TaxID=402884 RepID=A0A2T4JGZ7_9RHOB|nr:hypothetical protein [Cereibacter changlensis]PTE17171.1 hypothetical protein C5F48_24165 [Cereibacter changlensis JA139]PZX46480.1 hypothetical protein LX76_04645 [Cereibacter changlensis]
MTPRHEQREVSPDVRALLDAARAEAAAKRSARLEAEDLRKETLRAKVRKRHMHEKVHSVVLIAIIAVLWGVAVLACCRGDFLPRL